MNLPVMPEVSPMLSKGAPRIPAGEGWVYEPKWDGFRGIVFRDGDEVHIGSRNGQPLERYFPELVEWLKEALPARCVLDGEIVVGTAAGLDFDALSQRIHPAASRVQRLAAETPASFVAFDILAIDDLDLRQARFDERRARLVDAVHRHDHVGLTPQTSDPEEAESWFTRYEGAGCDGVVAKRVEQVYAPGLRVMVKVKHTRTIDCVVGGYRLYAAGPGIGSMLLGLYDRNGVFHFVGHTSSFNASERKELLTKLQAYSAGDSFGEGRTPGEPSRWSAGKDASWFSVRPELVCEVAFERMQGPRFRHSARLLRWRTDKAPAECTFDQLELPEPFDLGQILR